MLLLSWQVAFLPHNPQHKKGDVTMGFFNADLPQQVKMGKHILVLSGGGGRCHQNTETSGAPLITRVENLTLHILVNGNGAQTLLAQNFTVSWIEGREASIPAKVIREQITANLKKLGLYSTDKTVINALGPALIKALQ